jgi:putative glycosyltransferase (TIGR04372 family)
MYRRANIYMLNSIWDHNKPVVRIPDSWTTKAAEILRELGLPENQNYVCIHARTAGYSPEDETAHYSRNSNISDYRLAIDYLIDQGLYIIRMGDQTMPAIQANPKVIDYATSKFKADWLDLYIASNCQFFLTGASGAAIMASVFGRPIVMLNGSLPFNFSFSGTSNQIGIPKLMRQRNTGKLIDFASIFQSGLGAERLSERLASAGVDLIDNTPEEILEVVAEMVERISGSFNCNADDTLLQSKMQRLIPASHYSFGTRSKCGRDFLRRYSFLLPDV